jgi:HPt (histidine-containing phosphotransfer) domain-containing protein
VPDTPAQTLKAATGVVELLLATDLTLEQKHYALTLARLLACDTPASPLPDAAPEAGYIDREVLAELHHYLPASGCAAILAQFRETAEQGLGELAQALAAEAPDALGRAAHSLIGTVGSVGMFRVAEEARAILTALRQGDWVAAAGRADALPSLYAASIAALDSVIATFNRDPA